MNLDAIFETFNRRQVDYLLIGGMNFLLRHAPILTFDADLWIQDSHENRWRCEMALVELEAEWGPTDATWGPVKDFPHGWLESQMVFCLNSTHGAIDIFRSVRGLDDWSQAALTAVDEQTSSGTPYRGLSDALMLQCQLALEPQRRKQERVKKLESVLKGSP